MSGFNTSSRKEDVSLRLKTVNVGQAKNMTKKLEVESRKMEERLQELKLAMTREKEERELQGGGFWKSGQHGELANHAQVVLMKPPEKPRGENRTRKIKILKDEPLDKPVRSKQPGTMAHIAQKQVPKDNVKIKGPKCGQCEQKGAAVTCLECGEDYCASCFASFHLKGALRKHRSVPLQVNRPRKAMTPRKDLHSMANTNGQPNNVIMVETNPPKQTLSQSNIAQIRKEVESRNSPLGTSHSFDSQADESTTEFVSGGAGGTLWGEYKEEESASDFQAALKAWRSGGSTDDEVTKRSTRKTINPRVVSPVKTPIVQMEMGTETNENMDKKLLEIHFNSTVSYADKLLLKQHRRTDVNGLQMNVTPSPRREQSWEDEVRNSQVLDQDEDNRVEFEALFSAVIQSPRSVAVTRPDSNLAIIDLSDASSTRSSLEPMEESSYYEVQENLDSDIEPVGRMPTALKLNQMCTAGNSETTNLGKSEQYKVNGKSSRPSSTQKSLINSKPASNTAKKIPKYKTTLPNEEKAGKVIEPRPKSKSSTSRAASMLKSRPASRTKSRAASRISQYGEGLLTKTPSEHLKIVAKLSRHVDVESVQYYPFISDFFSSGVHPVQEDRVISPTKTSRPQSAKLSNKLYAMAPRSWRPASSLGDTIPDGEVKAYFDTVDMTPFITNNNHSEAENNLNLQREQSNTIVFSLSSHNTPEPNVANQLEPETMRDNSTLKTDDHAYEPHVHSPYADKTSHNDQQTIPSSNVNGICQKRIEPSRPTGKAKLFTIDLSQPVSKAKTDLKKTTAPEPSPRRPSTASGRISQAIVIEGDDFSTYNQDDYKMRDTEERQDESEALDQLEWEIASHDGRITADGKISRMSIITPVGEEDMDIVQDDGRGTGLTTPSPQILEIENGITAEDLMGDFEEMEELIMSDEITMENEVKALQ